MNESIKLISINIEGDNHFQRIIPFLKQEDADVVCLQEVLDRDVEYLKKELGMSGAYAPLMHIEHTNKDNLTPHSDWGLMILTKLPPSKTNALYYSKISETLPIHISADPTHNNRMIIVTEVIKNAVPFKIITTHFTWSPNGEATPLQHKHMDELQKLLDAEGEFVLCGDFNAPRGRAVWQRLAERYTDNIPVDVTTTLDQQLHKIKNLQYVVDGLFSTKQYRVEDVRVVDELSDHKGIVATITK